MECINCGECISVCPTKAISYKGSKIILPDSEIEAATTEEEKTIIEEKRTKRVKVIRIISSLILIATLCFSLVYCNFINNDGEEPPIIDDGGEDDGDNIPFGSKVGNKCQGYDLERIDGNGTVNVLDLKGKIVVVNFWGTWCTPCVNELPHFNQVAEEYADEVVIIAVHSVQSNRTAKDFVDKHYPDTKMIFAFDQKLTSNRDMYFTLLGGTSFYPRTLVIDEKGVITYTTDSPLTHEELVHEIEKAKNQ